MKNLFKIVIAFALILSVITPFSTSTAEAATKTYSATVKADKLNVREKASTNSKKLGTLNKGKKVTVYVKNNNGWSTIKYKYKNKNRKAYVSAKYLKFSSNVKKWAGEYTHGSSGSGMGAELTIKNLIKSSFDFIISEYGRSDSTGEWVYTTHKLKGKANVKNGVGYYNKNGCSIVFDYVTKAPYVNKNAVYTDVSGSCKVGDIGDESRDLPNDEKMGYIRN